MDASDSSKDFQEWKNELLRLIESGGFSREAEAARGFRAFVEADDFVRGWNCGFNVEQAFLFFVIGERCLQNSEAVQKANKCGCFYCLAIFSPEEIDDWCDGCFGLVESALCPRCGIDSVIPETSNCPINAEFLQRVHEVRFAEATTQFDIW